MGLPRSTYYDTPATEADTEIVARITAICEEFEAYGYRRVGAELRHQGIVVNGKKIRRLMRQHDLQPKRRRRFIATTDSDHDSPIFSNRAKDVTADRPNQLWVADITYVAIAVGFVYAAVILDAWSRRVVGYAIALSRKPSGRFASPPVPPAWPRWASIDTRLTLAALKAAVRSRQPPRGCIHHSDRGSGQSRRPPVSDNRHDSAGSYRCRCRIHYRKLLAKHGLIGSMSRRGNPYESAAPPWSRRP